MKTYTILFAEDVPCYGTVEIEAENDAAALDAAKAYDLTEVTTDPEWENSVSKRIVHIEDAEGNTLFHDVPLDNYTLCLESERAEMLEALELAEHYLSRFWAVSIKKQDDPAYQVEHEAIKKTRAAIAKAKGGVI